MPKMTGKLKPGNGHTGFKSPRDAGRTISKPSVPDSGKPSEQYSPAGTPADWKSGGASDSGKPNENK